MRSRIDRNAHRLGQSLLLGLALIGAADPNASGTQGTGLSCINDEDSLREAIRSARSGDTIAVSAETITLTGGELVIDKDLTISGQGPDKTTISGGARTRVFFVCPGVAGATEGPPAACPRVHFSNLTIADGKAQGGRGGDSGSAGAGNGLGGAGGGAAGMGGALFINGGHVTVDSVTFSANQALGGSGGDSAASGTPGAGGGGGVGGDGATDVNPGGMGGDGGSLGGLGGVGVKDAIGPSPGGEGAGGGAGRAGNRGGDGGFGGGGGACGGSAGFGAGYGGGCGGGGGGGGAGEGMGGAIFIRSGTLSLTHSTFLNNAAIGGIGGKNHRGGEPSLGRGRGGAIFIYEGAAVFGVPAFSGNTASESDPDVSGTTAVPPLPTCGIAGPDLSSPGVIITYAASTVASSPRFDWRISGNATFIGSTSGPTVSLMAGPSGPCSFTLAVTTTDGLTGWSGTCHKTVAVQPDP